LSNKNWLSSVSIEGLHNSIDLRTKFHPGINVIYGKNGVGKTTMLHMISNLTNMDFNSFSHIKFEKFSVMMGDETLIELRQVKSGKVELTLNGRKIRISSGNTISQENSDELKGLFGHSPVYVPAFRSVLQKISDHRHEMDRIRYEYEFGRSKSHRPLEGDIPNLKTVQCRAWFGEFIPQIRFPSVEEAESDLEQYWARANSAARHEEAKLVAEATNRILADLLGSEPKEVKSVIDSILTDMPEQFTQTEELASSFVQSFPKIGFRGSASKAADPAMLAGIYVKALIDAKFRGESMFARFNKFVDSMNSFLSPDRHLEAGAKYSSKPSLKISFNGNLQRSYDVSGLSSGERQLFTLLFASWRASDESTFMLIDEPEISLHIDWQRRILPEMYKQSRQQIIACTHSPEVAADLDEGYQVFDRFSTDRSFRDGRSW
jgi:predicted ATP-dependent endonuclease of OLD family